MEGEQLSQIAWYLCSFFLLIFPILQAAKPDEPSWDSPWGPGRPGWHIECSAMSAHYLTFKFDIHGGGIDLIFPHHENEIAQSCAACQESNVSYWMHNGHVTNNNEKMSKSLGNFFTIRQVKLIQYHKFSICLVPFKFVTVSISYEYVSIWPILCRLLICTIHWHWDTSCWVHTIDLLSITQLHSWKLHQKLYSIYIRYKTFSCPQIFHWPGQAWWVMMGGLNICSSP